MFGSLGGMEAVVIVAELVVVMLTVAFVVKVLMR